MMDRLTALSTNISDGVKQLNEHLARYNLPHPSFEPGHALSKDKTTPETQTLIASTMDAALEIFDLLSDPNDIPYIHNACAPTFVYDACLRFQIPENVPLNGDISYSDLSKAVGMEENAMTRLLRYGILYRIFQEKRPGSISHSVLSAGLISEDRSSRTTAKFIASLLRPSLQRIADAHKKWPAATEPTQTAFNLSENREGDLFSIVGEDPERVALFADTMSAMGRKEDISKDYPFGDLGSGKLVELGGSRGEVAFKIARTHPSLNIIVQDLAQVVESVPTADGVEVSFMAHDFFSEQPVRDADAYMIRWCLHDWSDPYALKILKALVPAMRQGTKLLIVDAVFPPFGVLPNPVERSIRIFDIAMMSFSNAKERTLDEWKTLFAAADSRFQLQRVLSLRNSHLSVMELVWNV